MSADAAKLKYTRTFDGKMKIAEYNHFKTQPGQLSLSNYKLPDIDSYLADAAAPIAKLVCKRRQRLRGVP